jgi:hypothetical protein
MRRICLAAVCMILLAASFDAAAQTRIRFGKGRTSATVAGTAASYAGRTYVLGALYGQYLSANVSSRGDCLKLNNGATSTSYVTRDGNNYLYLSNRCARSVSFPLTVSINFGSD